MKVFYGIVFIFILVIFTSIFVPNNGTTAQTDNSNQYWKGLDSDYYTNSYYRKHWIDNHVYLEVKHVGRHYGEFLQSQFIHAADCNAEHK